MVNKKENRTSLENLQYGDIVKYDLPNGKLLYLVVEEVRDGRVRGQIASPIGVNSFSLDELAKNDSLKVVYKNDNSPRAALKLFLPDEEPVKPKYGPRRHKRV